MSQIPTVSFNFSKWKKKKKEEEILTSPSWMIGEIKPKLFHDSEWDKSIILNQQSVNPFMYNWTHPHKLHVGESKEK